MSTSTSSSSPSELIRAHHQQRKALIYIRQSTPHQVLTNQESLRLQYALKQRAQSLGWSPDTIEIIDADLGLTGGSRPASHRISGVGDQGDLGAGRPDPLLRASRVCRAIARTGILGSDICGYRSCLIADQDGIYDPATANGRLLLGLKRPAS
jgi:hypothetical protein